MKIALSANGSTTGSHIAPFSESNIGFVIYDSNNFEFSYLHHSDEPAHQQRSVIRSAEMMAGAGIEVLVVGGIALQAASTMARHGIRIYACISATVWEAIQALKLNMLPTISIESGGSAVWNKFDD